MTSIGHRGVTVVTIVTLIFMPVFRNHHWTWKLTERRTRTVVVECAAGQPCPKTRKTVKRVYRKPTREELRKAHAEGVGAPKPPTTNGPRNVVRPFAVRPR